MGGTEKEFVAKISYRYAWKISELLTIFLLARMLPLEEFGLGFFSLTIIYFLLTLIRFNVKDKENKELYNTLSVIAPMAGFVFLGMLIIASVFLVGTLSEAIKLTAVIVMFSSFVITPEMFYQQHGIKVYKSYAILQAFVSIIAFILAYFGFGYKSIAIPYILFYLGNTFILWSMFPLDLEPKINKEILFEIISSWKNSLLNNIVASLVAYSPLLFVGIYFGMGYFAFLYIAYITGFFLYENVTLFLNSAMLQKFNSMDKTEMFKVNMLHIMEYVSFIIVPLSIISVMLAKELATFFLGQNWSNSAEILVFLFLAGLVKGVSEVSRIAFIVKSKQSVINKIRLFELLFLAAGMLVLTKMLGLVGVAVSIFLASTISSFLYLLVSARMIGINLVNSRDYLYIFFSAALTILALGFLKELFGIKNIFFTVIYFLLGILFYIAFTFLFNKDFYRRFVRFAFSMVEK